MKTGSLYLDHSDSSVGGWTSFITPPDGVIVQIVEGIGAQPVYWAAPNDYVIVDGVLTADKWMTKLLTPGDSLPEGLDSESVSFFHADMGNIRVVYRVGTTVVAFDEDGPFQLEEPSWNSEYTFIPPE